MRRPNQAIVVVARKLLVAVWHVLSKEETDIRVNEEDLAYKILVLSWVGFGRAYASRTDPQAVRQICNHKIGS